MANFQRQLIAGQSLIGFHGPFPVVAVSIDNPTGQWLQVQSQDKVNVWQVPPYTLGWQDNLHGPVNSIDVLPIAGPTSLISTTTGDLILVTVYDSQLTPSPGDPFITKTEQPDFSSTTVTFVSFNSNTPQQVLTNILQGSLTKRIRVFSVTIFDDLETLPPQPGTQITEKVLVIVSAADPITINPVPPQIAYLQIGPNKLKDQAFLFPPIDLALGREVGFFGQIARPVGGGVSDNIAFYGNVVYNIV